MMREHESSKEHKVRFEKKKHRTTLKKYNGQTRSKHGRRKGMVGWVLVLVFFTTAELFPSGSSGGGSFRVIYRHQRKKTLTSN